MIFRDARPETPAVLAPLRDVPRDSLGTLRRRLSDEAERVGVLDIGYTFVDTPVGSLLLAATGIGLVRVAFASEGHDAILQDLADRISPRILYAPRRLEPMARQLAEYFAGSRRRFDVALDRRLSHGFRLDVLEHLTRIPYGETESYAQVAAAVGNPRAARAVGTACATNPLPVVVPCHRVVRSDGSFGRYSGGVGVKEALLALEGAA